ncbi:putative acetylhydrolase [Ameyamaea chiangmaiensis NBRC 103196]|uniref:Acetylhydrolase n=1 Tax=Ameyamaea chiangmaiensis TaxID=442969 RepID=A0A850PA01_9PROT|nr:GDSL-type esterase/lipase family protein [Ameyamaea chiangmaiensis]MBS4073725.1 acetylhydrolase [Ameyamaea chiangmaiensis]NVN39783.1 acetylhydrolase [Ameyamaea chiangmaiensis]GBQ68679.1 putative acetylhydrolase [Ameyamaea chiangmaiensis NBRC 103196]
MMRLLIRRACVPLMACAGVVLGAAASAPDLASASVDRLSTPWWKARFEAKQAEIDKGHYDIVWLGDSITQNFEKQGGHAWDDYVPVWNRFYGGRHALNLGFKGDSTCHVLWRLDHGELAFRTPPRLIILLIGANNFGHIHTDAAHTYGGIAHIVDRIHARLPETRILVLGVLPSIRSPWVDENTRTLNAHLSHTLASGRPWVTYQDVGAALMRDGKPDPARFLDPHLVPPDPPLHPAAPSQAEIARMIEPTVNRLLADSAH